MEIYDVCGLGISYPFSTVTASLAMTHKEMLQGRIRVRIHIYYDEVVLSCINTPSLRKSEENPTAKMQRPSLAVSSVSF